MNDKSTSAFPTIFQFAVASFLIAFATTQGVAQDTADTSQTLSEAPFEFRTTLAGWAEDRRLLVLDRQHNIGGRLYDRGIFRHITPKMGREYAHELLVQRFPSEAFDRRRQARNSLLVRVGSVRRDLLAFVSKIRSRIPLSADHAITFDAVLQQDGQATRPFLELEYTWQLDPRHSLGVQHTLSEYKRDLDVTARYEYSSPALGSAEVAFTFQNLYSDLLDQQLGVFPGDREVIRDYRRRPYFLSLSYTSPEQYSLRGELFGGVQPISRAIYKSQTNPEYRYRDDRRFHFLGALLEYRYSSFSIGLFYKRDVSWLRREGRGKEVAGNYTSRQLFQRVGPFLKGRWGAFRGMVRGFVGFYKDEQVGENYSESLVPKKIDYHEGQWGVQGHLFYEFETGPFIGLEYASFLRRYDRGDNPARKDNGLVFLNWTGQAWGLGPSNYGLVGQVGYEFSHGRIVFGVGYDLDGDDNFNDTYPTKDLDTSRFDGAMGRLILTW